MKKLLWFAVIVLWVGVPAAESTPQAGTSAANEVQAHLLLQQSLSVLTAGLPVTNVTLTGTARRIAGSDDESGSVTVKILSSGATRLDFIFPSGARSEFRSFSSNASVGGWSGPDGVSHSIPDHNLVNDWGWSPAFTLAAAADGQNSVVTLVGSETRNGQAVIHIVASQKFPALSSDVASLTQHLSQIDIFLDATTHLPVSFVYNIHPDDNALSDIPLELRFLDYRAVSGGRVPFHVQKFVNSSLTLDLQFENATFNADIAATQIGVS